jgi:hypothetical protein
VLATIRHQDYQFERRTAAGSWRWTARIDVSGSTPTYEVRDITSPWGVLRDSIPIPGEIIEAMAEELLHIREAFSPVISVGPASLTFSVDEGRGYSEPVSVSVANDGTFGSLLGATIGSSAGWLKSDKPFVGGVPSGGYGTFDAMVDSTSLQVDLSPYSGTFTIQDPNATNTPKTIPVTVEVRPRAFIELSDDTLTFYVTKPLTEDFPPIPTQRFHISNSGPSGSLLQYQVAKLLGMSNWLASFAPPTGLIYGGAAQNITVLVQPPPDMSQGTYEEVLRISGYSDNLRADLTVRLVIT